MALEGTTLHEGTTSTSAEDVHRYCLSRMETTVVCVCVFTVLGGYHGCSLLLKISTVLHTIHTGVARALDIDKQQNSPFGCWQQFSRTRRRELFVQGKCVIIMYCMYS